MIESAYSIDTDVQDSSLLLNISTSNFYTERELRTPIYEINDTNLASHIFEISENHTFFKKPSYGLSRQSHPIGVESKQIAPPGTRLDAEVFMKALKVNAKFSHPKIYPHIEISKSGLLRASISLFQPSSTTESKPLLIYNPKVQYAVNELYRLNGICEVSYDRIKLFNGTEVLFRNSERSILHSLGGIREVGKRDKEQFYYWGLFLNRVVLSNFEDDFFREEIFDKLRKQDLEGFNLVSIKLNSGER